MDEWIRKEQPCCRELILGLKPCTVARNVDAVYCRCVSALVDRYLHERVIDCVSVRDNRARTTPRVLSNRRQRRSGKPHLRNRLTFMNV